MIAFGFKKQLEIGELKNELTTIETPIPAPAPNSFW